MTTAMVNLGRDCSSELMMMYFTSCSHYLGFMVKLSGLMKTHRFRLRRPAIKPLFPGVHFGGFGGRLTSNDSNDSCRFGKLFGKPHDLHHHCTKKEIVVIEMCNKTEFANLFIPFCHSYERQDDYRNQHSIFLKPRLSYVSKVI